MLRLGFTASLILLASVAGAYARDEGRQAPKVPIVKVPKAPTGLTKPAIGMIGPDLIPTKVEFNGQSGNMSGCVRNIGKSESPPAEVYYVIAKLQRIHQNGQILKKGIANYHKKIVYPKLKPGQQHCFNGVYVKQTSDFTYPYYATYGIHIKPVVGEKHTANNDSKRYEIYNTTGTLGKNFGTSY